MGLFISLIYAPLIFFGLKYFDLQEVALVIFVISSLWFVSVVKKELKQRLYPLFYIIVSLGGYFFDALQILKVLPLLIASGITAGIFYTYITNRSFIFYFIDKFLKKEIDEVERQYIQKSTLFWVYVTLLNTVIHFILFLRDDLLLWTYYCSVGGYVLLGVAGLIQFIHKEFVFEKRRCAK